LQKNTGLLPTTTPEEHLSLLAWLPNDFYLCGNRWQQDSAGQVAGAELIHKYSASGDFVASYLPFPEQAKAP
jgi:hypothetical protein